MQISLWETVLKLRNGSYYEDKSISEFLSVLNACRNNLYDNADLAYSQDEGAVLRKLMNVFSLRPTIIATKPIYSIASYMPGLYGIPSMMGGADDEQDGDQAGDQAGGDGLVPFDAQPVYTITASSVIVVQLPPYVNDMAEPKDLRAGLSQTVWTSKRMGAKGNYVMVPQEVEIQYSKEVLIIYVNRRIQRLSIRTFTNPLAFSQLPLTMNSFERLNAYPLHVPPDLNIRSSEEVFQLRSVVAVTETEIKQGDHITNLITGSTALIMKHRDVRAGFLSPYHYLYDPFGASLPVRHPSGAGYFTNKPISTLQPIFTPPPTDPDTLPNPSWFDRASRNGTIFIYAKPSGYNRNETIAI